jgi:hypothetical protein
MILRNRITRKQLFGLIIPGAIAISYMLFFMAVLVFGTGFLGWAMGTFFSILALFLIFGFERVYIVYEDKLTMTRRLYGWLSKKEKELDLSLSEIRLIHIWKEKEFHYSGLINTYIYLKDGGSEKVKFCINEDKGYASFFKFIDFLTSKGLKYEITTNVRAFKQVLDKHNIQYSK